MKKNVWMLCLALIYFIQCSIIAFAGDINSAEQKVIDAISGTYEYEGAYYKVTDAYISKVVAYLSKDSIDMKDSQAQSYINQFYSNFATGISAGYLIKIGDVENPDTDSDDSESDTNTDNNKEDVSGTGTNTDNNKENPSGTGTSNQGTSTGDLPSQSQGESSESANQGKGDNDQNTNANGSKENDAVTTDDKSKTVTTVEDENFGTITKIPSANSEAAAILQNPSQGISNMNQTTDDGQVVDSTIGSTTDGEIEYTVFSMDRDIMYVWDTETLDVHSEAYKDSDVIGTLNKGDAVTITGAATTGWAQIDFEGEVGYVSAVYLRTQGFMDSLEEASGEIKDYSDAAPLKKTFNFVTIAIVIIIACIIASGGIIIWHRNKSRKR